MIKSEAVRGFPDHAVIDDPDFKFRIACKFSAIGGDSGDSGGDNPGIA